MNIVWINEYDLLKIGYPLRGNQRAVLISAPVVKAGRSNKISEVRVRLLGHDQAHVTLPVHAICGVEIELENIGELVLFFDRAKKWQIQHAPVRKAGPKVSDHHSDAAPRTDSSS